MVVVPDGGGHGQESLQDPDDDTVGVRPQCRLRLSWLGSGIFAAMRCPKCGGEATRAIAPGYWECITPAAVTAPGPGVADPGQGLPMTIVRSEICYFRFQSGGGGLGGQCACGTDAIATCVKCATRMCGDHSTLVGDRRLCSKCYAEYWWGSPAGLQEKQRRFHSEQHGEGFMRHHAKRLLREADVPQIRLLGLPANSHNRREWPKGAAAASDWNWRGKPTDWRGDAETYTGPFDDLGVGWHLPAARADAYLAEDPDLWRGFKHWSGLVLGSSSRKGRPGSHRLSAERPIEAPTGSVFLDHNSNYSPDGEDLVGVVGAVQSLIPEELWPRTSCECSAPARASNSRWWYPVNDA